MDKSDYQRLLHIKIHCEDIEDCINRFGNNQQTFINDRAYFNAVAMSILQIGEIANSLSEEFKIETANEKPWQMIRGMRNIIAHAYGEIDEEYVMGYSK